MYLYFSCNKNIFYRAWLYMDNDVRKSCLRGFLSGHSQTSILSYNVNLDFCHFARSKYRYDTVQIAKKKTTVLIRLHGCVCAFCCTQTPKTCFLASRAMFTLKDQKLFQKLLPLRLYCSFKFTNSVYCVAFLNYTNLSRLLLS